MASTKRGAALSSKPAKAKQASSTRHAPEVVTFFDPIKAMQRERVATSKAASDVSHKVPELDFDVARREVNELGVTQFRGRRKREYEEKRLLELGVKKTKGKPIPARIGFGLAKKRRERKQKEKMEARLSGMDQLLKRKGGGTKKARGKRK